MNLPKIISMVVILCSPSFFIEAGGGSGEKYISDIYIYPGGIRIRSSEGNWENPDDCSNPSLLFISPDHAAYDSLLSAALSIQARGVKFRAFLSGCSQVGDSTYPTIWGINSYSS